VVARSPFGAIVDVDAELRQLGVIRIITGLLCLTRMAPQVWSLQYYFGTDGAWYLASHAIGGVVVLVLAGLVAAGVLTPLSTVALLITTRRYETEIASASLATDLLCLLLTMLVVTSAGARLSVDAVLLRQQRGWPGAPVRLLYRVIGVPSTRGLQAILLLFFVALALINLGGVVHHWFDDAWREGQAMAMILSSTYMSRVWPVWRSFETSWPEAAVWTSWFITKTQLVMQTSMLALVWWRPAARLLVFWGCAFFLGSIVALQLHYLGAFELLLWIALFHRPRVTVAQRSSSFTRPLRAEALFARTATAFLAVFVLHEGWALAGMHPYPFPTLRENIAMVGVHSPIVFNRRDQSLGDAWSVVYFGNREELLPYHGRHGERMGWTLWNDLLLYRNSVRWRGEFDPAAALDPHSRLVSRLVDLTLFDHRRRGVDASVYVADYYIAPASDTERPAEQRFQSRYLGSTRFQCSGRNLDARCIVETAEAPAAK
jgi:hypothetical protein